MEHPVIHQGRLAILNSYCQRGELLVQAQGLSAMAFNRVLASGDLRLSEVVLYIAMAVNREQVLAAAQWQYHQGLRTPSTPQEALDAVSDWQRRCLH